MKERERLVALAQTLPAAELRPAVRYLEYLQDRLDDPVLRALEDAPFDNEPLTDEDEAALAEAFEDLEQGRIFTHEEIRREMLEKV